MIIIVIQFSVLSILQLISPTAALDFTSTPLTVTFASQQTIANVCISIIDDTAVEDRETFTAELSTSETSVTFGRNNIAINIIDDDGKVGSVTLGVILII